MVRPTPTSVLASARSASIAAALGLCACAVPIQRAGEAAVISECRSRFAEIDTRIDAAGARDARHHRIPGYPYLRSDRFLASFGPELGLDQDRFWRWQWLLRETDSQAREVELLNLGLAQGERAASLAALRHCGATLSDIDFADAEAQARLIDAAQVPDDYSLGARTLGLYPLAVPFLKLGIASYQSQVRRDYAQAIDALETPGPLILWTLDSSTKGAAEPLRFSGSEPRDELGRIALTGSQWQALAEAHAPSWWIETAGDHDRPGSPRFDTDGPTVDPHHPVVYFQPGFTRFGGQTLVQMSYLIWFSARPASGFFDPYAGRLDGVIWRVTLDRHGAPIAHDSIHACGCYHYWFAQPGLQRRDAGSLLQEAPLFPQSDTVDRDVALRIQSGTHYLRRVVPRATVTATASRSYELRPYEGLLSLPQPDGARRSLFGPDGIVPGTERAERFWLWPSGVRSPGAMRVQGRHATAFVGRAHFDDAFALEHVFVPTAPAGVGSR